MLLAFFLPLKVVILLGSDGIPRYFPPLLERVDRDALIIGLAIAAIVFYLVYLFAERVIEWGSERGATQLVARGRKMVLFEGQDLLARRSYQRYVSALAGGIFVTLAILLLLWLYPAVGGLMLAYTAFVAIMWVVGVTASPRLREALGESLASWASILAGVGFMMVFGYLVVDFLYRDPPGLIPAVIALLLSRQGFNRLAALVPSLNELYQKRSKLDALFFHRTAYVPASGSAHNALHQLMFPEDRARWVPQVLKDLAGESPFGAWELRWWETGIRGIYGMQWHNGKDRLYLIKVFDRTQASHAVHEATLLATPPAGLPGPEWVGATEMQGCRCHVLRLPAGELGAEKFSQTALWDFRKALLQVKPGQNLVARYTRSRSFLWQRLSLSMLTELRVAAEESSLPQLALLEGRLEEWRHHLARLPLAFTSQDIGSPQRIFWAMNGPPCLLHWGRWALEPVGAGWPVSRASLRKLIQAVSETQSERATFRGLDEASLMLSALTAQLESACKDERYDTALKHLTGIQQCLDRLAH